MIGEKKNKSISLKILVSRKLTISLHSPLYSKHEDLGVFKQKKPSKYWVLKVSSGASRNRILVSVPLSIDL